MIERMYNDEYVGTPKITVTKTLGSGINWTIALGNKGELLSEGDRVKGTYYYGNYSEECEPNYRDYPDPFGVRFTLDRQDGPDLLKFSGVLKKITPDVIFIDCTDGWCSQILVAHLSELKSLRKV